MYFQNYTFADSVPCFYQADSRSGFVTESIREKIPSLQIPETNAAFCPHFWFQGKELTQLISDSAGTMIQNGEGLPLILKLPVPRGGNYKVSVQIAPGPASRNMILFTGRRRIAWMGDLAENQAFSEDFIVNVSDIIPRGQTERVSDLSISLAVSGSCPRITSVRIQETDLPTLFIAGDSTVTDQAGEYPYAPEQCYCGWGQAFPLYLGGGIGLSNHAHSGLTSETFRSEGHYDIIQEAIRPGDYFFMQFGHNDQKLSHLKASEGYRDRLIRYIQEIREKEAVPVIVTPLARNSWKGNDGSYNDLLKEYAEVCLAIGREYEVPVLDLHQRSMDFIVSHGLEDSKRYFFPGDFTHTNDYGAVLAAYFTAAECLEKLPAGDPLRAQISVPDSCPDFVPPDQIFPAVPPEGFLDVREKQSGPALPPEIDRPEDPLLRAEALDLMIQAAHFFPTNVYNDMFEDIVGHEWFAGSVECAFQNGMIEDALVRNGQFFPLAPVTLEEFMSIVINGLKSRVSLPDTSGEPDIPGASPWTQNYLKAGILLEFLTSDISPSQPLTRREGNEIARKASALIG